MVYNRAVIILHSNDPQVLLKINFTQNFDPQTLLKLTIHYYYYCYCYYYYHHYYYHCSSNINEGIKAVFFLYSGMQTKFSHSTFHQYVCANNWCM